MSNDFFKLHQVEIIELIQLSINNALSHVTLSIDLLDLEESQ